MTKTEKIQVPSIRLDTFMDAVGIEKVDYLKIDLQGADLAVIRSAGNPIYDIRRISMEVQITPIELCQGSSTRHDILTYLSARGFRLVDDERQSNNQEENLTFERAETSSSSP